MPDRTEMAVYISISTPPTQSSRGSRVRKWMYMYFTNEGNGSWPKWKLLLYLVITITSGVRCEAHSYKKKQLRALWHQCQAESRGAWRWNIHRLVIFINSTVMEKYIWQTTFGGWLLYTEDTLAVGRHCINRKCTVITGAVWKHYVNAGSSQNACHPHLVPVRNKIH